MRRLKLVLRSLLILGFIVGCNPDDTVEDQLSEPQLMVEAYIFANEHVNHVKVAKIHLAGEAEVTPVNDANITLSQGNKSATLQRKQGSEGLYEIADPTFTFSGDEPISLEILVEEKIYTSSTTFPSAISSLELSNETVNISDVETDLPLTNLSWDDSVEGRTYSIFSKGVWSDTSNTFQISPADDSPLFTLHQHTSVDLFSDHFTHVGSYQLYVSAVNDEYIQMHAQNSSPNLREAPSNIEGAWGVFTAFNGQFVDITVN